MRLRQVMCFGAQAAGLPQTKAALYSAYLKRVQSNLHVVLAMSPVSESQRFLF